MSVTRNLSKSALAATLVGLVAMSSGAKAGEHAQNLGPVESNEPILTTVGNKRVIAFHSMESGHCQLSAVVWNSSDIEAVSASRFRVRLEPHEMVYVDTPDNKTLALQCGEKAETLEIVKPTQVITAGAAP